ncbi:MAG: ImmA/IrrE family metallo-endopeptidase [Candidatus Pacebacteria bacterium]|nr:ImmA/IrrE family metallo-endopeptidase [Candidatus Paceibacterota bacterium]
MRVVNFINKENLRIARENIGIDSKLASKKITASSRDLVFEWESGHSLPTWGQVLKMAKIYNVSEFLFFSEKLINQQKTVPDYRVGKLRKGSDNDVKKLINLVMTRQKWIEKYVKEEGMSKNKLQGLGASSSSSKNLAELITEKLKISIADIKKLKNRRDVLNYFIKKAEQQGIFVGKTISYHKINVEELRGLYISHEYCPFIIINRKDSLSAQIFSLVHELAHFFRKSDAISNVVDFRSLNEGGFDHEEVFCNKVAVEILLPANEFRKDFYDKFDIYAFSNLYKVSELFIFYRLKQLKKIPPYEQEDLEKQIKEEMQKNLIKKREKENLKKGGNYNANMKDSNGSLFNKIVYNNYLNNKMGYVEASRLLLFSPEKYDNA